MNRLGSRVQGLGGEGFGFKPSCAPNFRSESCLLQVACGASSQARATWARRFDLGLSYKVEGVGSSAV